MTQATNCKTLLDTINGGSSEHVAIRTTDGLAITYESLVKHVEYIGKYLVSIGVKRDDRVGIVIPNSAETILAFLGVASVATAAPLNPAYKADEFKFFLEDTKATAILTGSSGADIAIDAAPEGIKRVQLEIDHAGDVKLSSDAQMSYSNHVTAPQPSDVALILHTSGTTSRPKMVPLTHYNLTSSIDNIIATYGLSDNDISLCIMPLFHVHGLMASTLSTLSSGGTVVVPPRFNALHFLRIAEEQQFTWYTAVPSIHQALLSRSQNREKEFQIPSLRFIRSCSSALAPSTMHSIEEIFQVPVLEAYGMTEASHQMSSNPMPPGHRIPGSVGMGTGVNIGIMNESGQLLEPGSRGEVVINGPNVFSGYEENSEANATAFDHGWFRTGDEGALDNNGYLSLLGRIKEIINRSGEKISPGEIDEILLSHPSVSEAVAFGIPHSVHGEEPSAAVVIDGNITEKELISFCRQHLADFKCPRNIHIVNEIPKTATGKIQRRIVADAMSSRSE